MGVELIALAKSFCEAPNVSKDLIRRSIETEADPVSIFGGIVVLNRLVDVKTAAEMNKIFLEIVIAPAYAEDALVILKKKKNLRLLQLADIKLIDFHK